MKIAYLDCASGISGDMTLGALIDAGVDIAAVQAGIDSLGLASCRLVAVEVKKKGFRATQITMEHQPEQAHRHLHHITDMIDASRLSERQKDFAKRIFVRLGEAEAKVHGTTIRKVHFHEVGAVDSIADIVGAAIAWDLLAAERIMASPVPTGTGFVQIAHGRCSIPAPATGELLKGIPLAASSVEAELTTPTGAAILATIVDSFGPLPAMKISTIGYGAGQRDLEEQPNLLRLLVGETADPDALAAGQDERLWVVETNLDDISGELIGYCTTQLWGLGVLDVYATPTLMKKGRPGVVLSVVCRPDDVGRVEAVLFAETTTLGVRRFPVSRRKLDRRKQVVETPWGSVEGTVAVAPGQPPAFSPEFESCRRVAAEKKVPLRAIYEAARRSFDPRDPAVPIFAKEP